MGVLWEKLVRPLVFRLDAERAHEIGSKVLKLGLGSAYYCDDATFGRGEIERFGLRFSNPIGIAAGFDKNGVVVDALASLGFGFVEVGTVTYEPQPGNPKPRLFRLPADRALINRLGFNNDGAAVIAERLSSLRRRCIVGVNIGRNRNVLDQGDAVENYVRCFETVLPVADYVAVNVSSPNTPGLRDLQEGAALTRLLKALQGHNTGKPLLVKIAPDLAEDEIRTIVYTCVEQDIAAIIATNTTASREGLVTDADRYGSGGLSGRPLTKRSNSVISTIYRHTNGELPVIGVGGIFTAQDAFEKFAAGASLVQAYTGFVYNGPSFARDINIGLIKILDERGIGSLDDIIGTAAG